MNRCLTIHGRTVNGALFNPKTVGDNKHWTDTLLNQCKGIKGVYTAWLTDGTMGLCVTKKYDDVSYELFASIIAFAQHHELCYDTNEDKCLNCKGECLLYGAQVDIITVDKHEAYEAAILSNN